MKKIVHDIYYKPITFSNIYNMWNIVRKTCKNKNGIYLFNLNKNTNIYEIGRVLLNKSYKPLPYKLFMIFEPKERLVMSQSVSDKIVNHFIANFYLIPYLEKKLIDSNVATRKGKGTKHALNLLEKYINEIRMKYTNQEIYVLKLDISKYFYNINHSILINMLESDIKDKNVINLIKIIISETDKPYINDKIVELNKKCGTSIPLYKKGVGLSIGAMTSQFLAIYYLNDIDHFIKEKLNCSYFIRYMDDYIILDINKKRLQEIKKIIAKKIMEKKLQVNPKSNIYKLSKGILFVGYRYVLKNNKLEILYNKKTKAKIEKKLNILEHTNKIKYYKTYASYYGYFIKVKKMERKFSLKAVDKYNSLKKKNLKKVVFIREGKFYWTFNNDAKIIWCLFDYKWNDDAIIFGDSASSKVFDTLKKLGIGYIVSGNEELVVNGDDMIYELEFNIADINYNRYSKKNEIFLLVDNLLTDNINNYEKIINYLNIINEKNEQKEHI